MRRCTTFSAANGTLRASTVPRPCSRRPLRRLRRRKLLQHPSFSRPSQGRAPAAAPQRPAAPRDDDIPPPEAPDYPDDPGPPPADYDYDAPPPPTTPEDEAEMMAEAAVPVDQASRRDPEEMAGEMLVEVLGARKLD